VPSGGRVTPGPGPYDASGVRVLETANLNLAGGSRYTWEINSWAENASAGNSGNGFDQVRSAVAGAKLNLAGASAVDRVTIAITSLNGSAPGQIPNFDAAAARSWVIADYASGNATGGVQNFAADKFTLDVSAFANNLQGGVFSIDTDVNSNKLVLWFTPVPEPGTVLFAAGLGLLGMRVVRRRPRPGV
jgi:PEP-CTERM motif-containing protein